MWASFEFLMSGLLLFGVRWRDEKGGHQGGWMEPPPDFFLVWRWGIHPSQLPHLASAVGADHPPFPTPRDPHLTPHRRGCPRRALFRVLGHPKVFALLFSISPSCELLWAPRGIVAILWPVWGHLGGWRAPSSTHHTTTPPSQSTPLRMP